MDLVIVFAAISFESVQFFIEGMVDETQPKLPDHLVGVNR